MRIEDRFTVDAPQDAVWLAITDPAVVAACLPGCEAIEMISATAYRAAIRVEVGPIRTRFQVEVELVEQDAPRFVRCTTRGEEGTRASMLQATSEMTLSPVDERATEIAYGSDVQVTGRLGKFGLGVMKKKAENLGRVFAGNFRARLEAS